MVMIRCDLSRSASKRYLFLAVFEARSLFLSLGDMSFFNLTMMVQYYNVHVLALVLVIHR